MNAIFFPSGDQRACLSWAPELLVRLRTGPFSTGTVNTSPRATKRARSPLGDRAKPSMLRSALMREGREAPPSVGTEMEIPRSLPSCTLNTRSSPFCS